MSTRLPLRVLIIEDSEFDARVIVQALRAGGYEVTWQRVETAPAMEASLKSPSVSWDVVLADYNMPEFNAPQALRILQQAGHDIPFIIVSGGIGEDVAVAAMKAGAHDYVMKGNPARLLPAVERELREAEVRRRRREAEGLLRESELRYRSLWETSPDAVLFCSTEGAIGFANPAAEKLFGWVAEELTGRPLTDLEPPGGGGLGRALAGAGAGGAAEPGLQSRVPVEGLARRRDGQAILVEVASSRLDLPDHRWFVLFVRDITEKRRNEAELRAREEQMRAAREIHQRLFPKSAPVLAGYDIAGISVPADATGGDYYDFLPMPDDHLGLVVADVSGHGLGPSLLMVETRALLRVVARNRVDPGEILTRANRVIAEDVEGQIYVTLLFVRLDARTGDLLFANAGHPAGVILDAGGEVRVQLRRTSGPLGFLRGAGPVSAPPLRLEPGDTLLLYTDGLREARRPAGTAASAGGEEEEFGLDRILEIVRGRRALGSAEVIRALCEAARAFAAPEPLEDDLTVVVVKRAGAGP